MYASSSRLLRRRGCGIIGLPNVGKSTLFNALTSSQMAKTGNYPFCTINANVSKALVFDERLVVLAKLAGTQKIVYADVEVVDVAGLIEGAHKGLGLGNRFLNDIRPLSAALHVVRCFEGSNGFGPATPLDDIDVIERELVLADLQSLQRREGKRDPSARLAADVRKRVVDLLGSGKPAHSMKCTAEERAALDELQLMSAKPVIYVCNVGDDGMKGGNPHADAIRSRCGADNCFTLCSLIEEETARFPREERLAFLNEYGVATPGAEALLHHVMRLLKLQTFFTVGPQMVKAWVLHQGATVLDAAECIHTDLREHFVHANVASWQQYLQSPTVALADAAMKKVDDKYTMQDGDVLIVEHTAQRPK